MKESKIISYLKSFAHLDPDKRWLLSDRKELAEFMEHTLRSQNRKPLFYILSFLRSPKFAVGALAFILFLGTGTGAAIASQESLPGDPLFQVKLFTEKIEKFVALDEAKKAELKIKFAGRRLEEAERLATFHAERAEHIQKNIERFQKEMEDTEDILDSLPFEHNRKNEMLRIALKLNIDSLRHEELLEKLESIVPESAKVAVQRAQEAYLKGRAVSLKIALEVENESEEDGKNNKDEEDATFQVGDQMKARGKIGAALNVVNAVEKRVERERERNGEESVAEAEAKLGEAKELLKGIEIDLENKEFISAFEKAHKVIRSAQEAKSFLVKKPGDDGEDEEDAAATAKTKEINGEDESKDNNNDKNDDEEFIILPDPRCVPPNAQELCI